MVQQWLLRARSVSRELAGCSEEAVRTCGHALCRSLVRFVAKACICQAHLQACLAAATRSDVRYIESKHYAITEPLNLVFLRVG
jgi:hypothetical protein